jgi:tRNA-dihydrouridine synthase B
MKFKPKNKIFLAPMEEVNDIAFRLLCKKAGAGMTYTPMIHLQSQKKIFLDDKPVLQLFGARELLRGISNSRNHSALVESNLATRCHRSGLRGRSARKTTGVLAEFMKKYEKKVSGWDFNLGCPASNAKKRGVGVFLHKDLKTIEKILKIMRQNTKKPLSVKLRISPYTLKIVEIANKYCDAIAIHPRTQSQGYSGKPNIKFAKQLKKYTKLPIIYSGNVEETNYKKFLKEFDYIMIGRKSIGNPNIFSELTNKKSKEITFKDYLKLAEKYKLHFRQIKFQAMQFTKGKRDSRKLRAKLIYAKTIKEIKNYLEIK